MKNIKELLDSHYEINNAIDSKLEQLAELKSLAAKVTSSPLLRKSLRRYIYGPSRAHNRKNYRP